MIRAVFVATLAFAAPLTHAQTTEELQRLLEERDARIRDLNAKLDALEKKPEDDDELNRALERTLVQQGAMVLPRRVYEVEPQLSYAHGDRDAASTTDSATELGDVSVSITRQLAREAPGRLGVLAAAAASTSRRWP